MTVVEYIYHLTHILVSTDAHSFTSIEILTLALRVEPEPNLGSGCLGS